MGRDPPQAPRQGRDRRTIRTARRRAASRRCCWQGAELYRAEAKNQETLDKYGHGTPDDWIERNLYTPLLAGRASALMLVDRPGAVRRRSALTIWAVQMLWIPITAAGIINGIGHYWGYRNFECADAVDQHRAVGHPDRRRRAAQQPPRLRHVGQAVVAAGTSSTSAGCTSASWRSLRPRDGAQGRAAAQARPRQGRAPISATLQAVITAPLRRRDAATPSR